MMRTLRVALVAIACVAAVPAMARAQATAPPPATDVPQPAAVPGTQPAVTPVATVPQVATPAPPEEGMNLRKQPEEDTPITQTWWFWGAAAGVVVTTVAIVLIAGRSQTEPKTDLGDMRAFR